MSDGTCLCGAVTWKFEGEPAASYHCHCKMCRKVHGAAFGSYYFVPANDFEWTSGRDTIVGYSSSSNADRAFCSGCGSMVPNTDLDGEFVYVPAGSHDDGPAMDCHIFAAHKAPWFDITGDLPRYDDFPPEVDQAAIPEPALPAAEPGVVRGSCLCGTVKFEVIEPFKVVHNCHCSRCRRARAAAHTTNGFVSIDGVRFLSGEEQITTYKLPEARFFAHAFCSQCGSGVPRADSERKVCVVPLGALDDDPQARAVDHIFVADKARWYEITDELPAFEQGPPG